MPKKIDDILNPNPEPNLIEDQLLATLQKAAEDGLALTKTELFNAARFNWLDVAPVGEGGVLLTIAAAVVDAELGVSKHMDELRQAALTKLVDGGRVRSKMSGEKLYYWIDVVQLS